MLPLPDGHNEPAELADWLEFNVLVGRGRQANLDDMRDALRTGALGYSADEAPVGRLEEIAADVQAEIASRAQRAQRAYPFHLKGSSLERRISSADRCSSTYAFCLAVSFLSWEKQNLAGHFPARIFEEVSRLVAQQYLGGNALRFGWPRVTTELPSKFGDAVTKLCERMGEGAEYRPNDASGDEKDEGLDVVAWRSIDERRGKLLLFGACATGQNWEHKLTELQPKRFCQTFLRDPVAPNPAKAFFTPRVVPQESWRKYTNKAGMLFDRCRVSLLVPQLPTKRRHGDVREWMQTAMRRACNDAE